MTVGQVTTDQTGWRFSPRLALFIGAGLLLLVLLVLAVPQLNFWFSIYWGYKSLKEVLYQQLHLSDAWSSLLARILAFFYGFAWTPLLYLAYRRNVKQIAVAFLCYMFLFGLVPFLKAAFGSDICFNQMTDQPEKWYVKNRDGVITLYDSPGYDSLGLAKRPVTTEVCQEYQSQKKGTAAHQLTGDVRTLEFFRSDDGSPRVWYDIGTDGSVRLFDGPGFDPETGLSLQPATPEIRDRALRDQETTKADAASALRRAEQQREEQQKEATAKADAEQQRESRVAEAAARKAESEHLREAKERSEQENLEAALRCRFGSPCTLMLAETGDTLPVSVPLGKTPCFDRTFWQNLDQLDYQTSSHGSPFSTLPCSRAEVFAGTCSVRYMDRFRFKPQPGVTLPRYWFVESGARTCNSN